MSHGEKFGEKNMTALKTVKVSETTHERLATLGHTLDSMNDIVVKLLDFWEQNHKEIKER